MHANTHISYIIVLCCTDNWRQFCYENPNLTPVTPNYPQVDHWPLNLDLEGLKLMYMH